MISNRFKDDGLFESSEPAESVHALADVWRRVVADRRTGEISDQPGLAVRWAESDFIFWNCLTSIDRVTERDQLEDLFSRSAAYLRAQSKPGLLWSFTGMVAPEHRPLIPEIADRAGLKCTNMGFGMAGDILPVAPPFRQDIEFVRIRTEDHLRMYADLNAMAYGFPLEAVRSALRGSDLFTSEAFAYLALVDGEPVSAAAAIANGANLFLILVATAPADQRRGYGEAVVRKALSEGGRATGLTRTTLHATLAGAPVYERIGYRKVSDIGFYGLK
ncbi:GNAT family N-acetyltransferase [Sphingomonas sp.]|uniref:GNAT family N-acetyltransferase n=1 Tax=Sphingomonas sp. TaxID=28214 RepID=UPI003B3A3498